MTTAQNDNSIDAVLDKIVIWQYDESKSICALIDQFKQWSNDTTGSVWDSISKGFNLATKEDATDFALALFGRIMGVPRLDVTVDGVTRTMSMELYRRILVAKFRLLNGNGSIADYSKFVSTIFGSNVTFTDNHNMSVAVEWTGDEPTDEDGKELKYAFNNYRKYIFSYPTGVDEVANEHGLRFWLGSTSESKPDEDVDGGGLDNSSFNWLPISVLETNGVKLTFTVPETVTNNAVKFIVDAPAGTPILGQDGSVVASCSVDGENTIVINPTIGEQTVFYIGENATTFRFYDPNIDDINGTTLLTAVDRIAWHLKNLRYSFRMCSNLSLSGGIRALVSDISSAYYGTAITEVPELPDTIESIRASFMNCTKLTTIREFPINCSDAYSSFRGCTSLRIPNYRWRNITNASHCYDDCTALIRIYPWSQNGFAGVGNRIILNDVSYTYRNCSSASSMKYRDANGTIRDVSSNYNYMPSTISVHDNCVTGAHSTLRSKFSSSWGGTK